MAANPAATACRATCFRALSTSNQVTFQGIPILAPVSSGVQRVFRITNVRANAQGLGWRSDFRHHPVAGIGFDQRQHFRADQQPGPDCRLRPERPDGHLGRNADSSGSIEHRLQPVRTRRERRKHVRAGRGAAVQREFWYRIQDARGSRHLGGQDSGSTARHPEYSWHNLQLGIRVSSLRADRLVSGAAAGLGRLWHSPEGCLQ